MTWPSIELRWRLAALLVAVGAVPVLGVAVLFHRQFVLIPVLGLVLDSAWIDYRHLRAALPRAWLAFAIVPPACPHQAPPDDRSPDP